MRTLAAHFSFSIPYSVFPIQFFLPQLAFPLTPARKSIMEHRRIALALGVACLVVSLNVPGAKAEVRQVVTHRVEPFDLKQVRLLDGLMKHAMELDRQYLLALDPDRLLHNFRVTAGLPSSAKPLGGWEEPKCELRGHCVGHYLSACALMYSATGDEQVKAKADYIVAELAKCQAQFPSGYLSAYPESFIERVEQCKPVWAPWYTLHKIYAGLIDMYVHCGNRQALEVMEKAAGWIQGRMGKLSDEQMQKMLGNEHGGMNDVLAELAAVTGNDKYLALSRRFNHHAVLDPLANREDKLTGLHANTQFPKILGAARQYELTGDESGRTIATFFWDVVTGERSYVCGGNSDFEHFSPKEHLSQALGPNTTETCNTYNMLKITRKLFTWDPKPEYADYYERALYNHILASQNPETGMVLYYLPLKTGDIKEFGTPNESFWCCTGTGIENHAKYGDSIYFHEGDQSLYVNLFIPSELTWSQRGLKVRQETSYPMTDATRLSFAADKPVELAVKLRYPYWAVSGFEVSINGQRQTLDSKPGTYACLTRTWQTGDTVDVRMPMSLRTEGFRDNPKRLAFLYGPLVLCTEVDPAQGAPSLVVDDPAKVATALEPVAGKPLAFRGRADMFRMPGSDKGAQPLFIPLHEEYRHPLAVYWDVLDQSGWKAVEARQKEEAAREKALEGRTLDRVRIGDLDSERLHKLQGKSHGTGEFRGRSWRHAPDEWFSYELKVADGQPAELLCTYWGSDVNQRVFDILVDGQKIATQRLENNRPDQFYDETYSLSAELTRGKSTIVVRFQAQPKNTAGGLFGLRVMRKE
jgi:DUF1680 family protein